jgi:D-alanyl-D-alanine carboxypeptidase (penicillin-binding protein 5/6)
MGFMRRRVGALGVPLFLLLSLAVCSGPPALAHAASGPPGLTCGAYVIYDVQADELVAEYHPELQQPIASLSKLMTAILANEHLRFDGCYRLTPEEQKVYGVDTMRADKMLELALVASNNEICRVMARLVAGGEPQFVQLMNRRAAELGLTDTHFVNCNGLPGDGQYSTPLDVLRLGRAALAYPRLARTMTEPVVELNGKTYKGTLDDLYARHADPDTGLLVGGKTGYTKAAGRCLCLLYESGGRRYIVVSFGSKDVKASFRDAELLLSYSGLYHGDVGTWN